MWNQDTGTCYIKLDDNETTKITSDEIDQFDWSLITGLNVSIGKHGTKNDQSGIASQYYYDITFHWRTKYFIYLTP